MEEWYNMSYQEINKIGDYTIRREYIIKHREAFIHYVNPLYSNLSNDKKSLFDVDTNASIKSILKRLVELNGGREKSRQILLSRIKK